MLQMDAYPLNVIRRVRLCTWRWTKGEGADDMIFRDCLGMIDDVALESD